MSYQDIRLNQYAQQILDQVSTVISGKEPVLTKILMAILARGHILLEDIPGVGKTTMALAFSKVLNLEYSRVQFTPDVLPSDVTGEELATLQTNFQIKIMAHAIQAANLDGVDKAWEAFDAQYNPAP